MKNDKLFIKILYLLGLFWICRSSSVTYLSAQDTLTFSKEPCLQFHGYLKDLHSAMFTDRASSLVTRNLIHNRLNFRWDMTGQLYLRAEARNRFYYGEQVKLTPGFSDFVGKDNGSLDLTYLLLDDTSYVFCTSIDRLLLNWNNDRWKVTVGRQRINWGVNLVWNPNDIFNAFNYFDFDYEERPGADAVSIRRYTGDFSSWEFAARISDDKDKQVGALLYRTNFTTYDLQAFAGNYYKDLVAGAGWAGNLKKTGFKGEVSYFHPREEWSDTTGALSLTLSLDRTLGGDYFIMASYLYSSEASGNLSGMNDFTGSSLSAKSLMPFRHSFFVQAGKGITPLLNGSMAAIYSPEDQTFIMMPSLTCSVSNNWELSLVGQSFFHQSGSTYGTMGNAVFTRLRWSF